MKTKIGILALILFFGQISAQKVIASDSIVRRQMNAVRTDKSIKIDGIIDEEAWTTASIADKFIEFQPANGKSESENQKSVVRVLYDDTGIYIGATLYDNEPDKIAKQLTERDVINNDDFFGVFINGYNDKQQSYEFIVTAAGVQFDAKATNDNGEDDTWNGIWYSAVKITDKG